MNGKQSCLFCLIFPRHNISMMMSQNTLRAGSWWLKLILFDLHRSYLGCEGMMENTSTVQEKQQVVQDMMVSPAALHEGQLVVEGII